MPGDPRGGGKRPTSRPKVQVATPNKSISPPILLHIDYHITGGKIGKTCVCVWVWVRWCARGMRMQGHSEDINWTACALQKVNDIGRL